MSKKSIFKITLILIISVFIILDILLFWMILTNHNNVKGLNIIRIDKDKVIIHKDGLLKSFYEPEPKSNVIWDFDSLGYEARATINSDSLNERYDYQLIKK